MKHRLPNIDELLQSLGVLPIDSLSAATNKYDTPKRPLLFNGQIVPMYAKKQSLHGMAARLNTSAHTLRRMIMLLREGGTAALRKAKWGRGGLRNPR